MNSTAYPKAMARALRAALFEHEIDLAHSACLEIVARQHGLSNWNTLRAIAEKRPSLSVTVFIQHGREAEAAEFYTRAFDASHLKNYRDERHGLTGFDLAIGDQIISVVGSNPRREAEPQRGGPFFPKEDGWVSAAFNLSVRDIESVLAKAVVAGAKIRDHLDICDMGGRCASFFDPFGHIWGITERARS